MDTLKNSPTPDLGVFLTATLTLAAAELKRRFGSALAVREKADASLCTDADLASEKIILERIGAQFPGDHVLSEEFGASSKIRPEGNHIWVIDPLDGTSNFANNYPFFAVSIARAQILKDGKLAVTAGGVINPMTGKTYTACRGAGAFLDGRRLKIAYGSKPFAKAFLCTGFYYNKDEALEVDMARFARVAQKCQTIRRDGAAALDLALVGEGVFDGFWEQGLQPWDVAAGSLIVTEAGGSVRNYVPGFDIEGDGIICGVPGVVDSIASLI